MKTLRVTVNGKSYDVQVEILSQEESKAGPAPVSAAPAPAPTPAAPAAALTPASGGDSDVLSPLAAVVISIDVQPGAQVAKDDKLVTLEAMKMNTFVTAPQAGTVGQIHVKPGDSVEEGQLLVSI